MSVVKPRQTVFIEGGREGGGGGAPMSMFGMLSVISGDGKCLWEALRSGRKKNPGEDWPSHFRASKINRNLLWCLGCLTDVKHILNH